MNKKQDHKRCDMEKEPCRKIYDKMILSLDGALSPEEEKQLMGEIEEHPCCFEKMHVEKAYREFLCTKITRKTVSVTLIESIKSKVREISG